MTKNTRKNNFRNNRPKRSTPQNNQTGKTGGRHVKASYPHFRRYRKANHPALILGEYNADEYLFRKVMHGEFDGNRRNEMIYPNPDPTDPNPMGTGKRKRHDKITNFDNKPYTWKYPKK